MTAADQTTTEKPQHIQQAEGLRALADFIEAHPEIKTSYLTGYFGINVWSPKSADELAALAKAAAKFGAKVGKDVSDELYNLDIRFGCLKTRALAERAEVCERVVTGTETVTKTVPDPKLLAQVPEIEVTETVETVEWQCKPLLAGGNS